VIPSYVLDVSATLAWCFADREALLRTAPLEGVAVMSG
jgi:hypothetical protein